MDTQKSLSIKIIAQVVIRDACGTWHGLCTVTSIHRIQKSTKKQPETRKQVSQWMAEGSRAKTKRNQSDKQKILKKKKRRYSDWEVDYWSMWSNIKAVVEEQFKKYIYLYPHSAYIIIMKWLCTYWPTINEQTCLNKPTSKRKLLKK